MICSIASEEGMRPSYYHSFGEPRNKTKFNRTCLNVTVEGELVLENNMLIWFIRVCDKRPRLRFDVN